MRCGWISVHPAAWVSSCALAATTALTSAAFAGVTVYFPASGSTVTPPVHIRAWSGSTHPITYTRIYVDNVSVWGGTVSSVNTFLNMSAGSHYVVVQSWDSTGLVQKASLNLTVKLSDGRQQVLSMPFLAGVTHVAGTYGFTQSNYLLEGASRIRDFAAPAIFVYMLPKIPPDLSRQASGHVACHQPHFSDPTGADGSL